MTFLANQVTLAQMPDQFEIVSVEFKGNNSIPTDLLQTVVQTVESPGWFLQFLDSFTGFGEEAIYLILCLFQVM